MNTVNSITLPLSLLHTLLTSPLTLSLSLSTLSLLILLIISGILSTFAVGVGWLVWGRGGVVEREGGIIYGYVGRRIFQVMGHTMGG